MPGAGDMGAAGRPRLGANGDLRKKDAFSIGTSEKSAKIKKAISEHRDVSLTPPPHFIQSTENILYFSIDN